MGEGGEGGEEAGALFFVEDVHGRGFGGIFNGEAVRCWLRVSKMFMQEFLYL